MSLINFKIHHELRWTKDCVMPSAVICTKFKIKNRKLYVSTVTLSTKDDVKLTKQLRERFRRSVYWNPYNMETKTRVTDNSNPLRNLLDVFFFSESKDCLFWLSMTLMLTMIIILLTIPIIELKETVTESIFFQ